MILAWLIIIPILGGLLALLAGPACKHAPRWIALAAMAAMLAVAAMLWWQHGSGGPASTESPWLVELQQSSGEYWIAPLGIQFHLAMDGLSLLMVVLTGFLGVMSVGTSWNRVEKRQGFYYFNLLWLLAGVTGVFLAMDLFLFYAFWEVMLVPMYFLIGIWGAERRTYATIKFFLFTQVSGLAMLLGILGLHYFHAVRMTAGEATFDYLSLAGMNIDPRLGFWLMMGFFAAMAVKLPSAGVHTWLPDAHEQAPAHGGADIAGLVIKVGAYGLLRFIVPLFPYAAADFRTAGLVLGVIGILYGGWMAFAQNDLKRFAAYSSISHMGFVLLGVFAWTQVSLQGVVMIIIASGISTAALLVIVGVLIDRTGTRDMRRMGGLWAAMPRTGGMAMFFAMAAMGLPALVNFVGEVLVLVGLTQAAVAGKFSIAYVVLGSCGFIVSVIYSLAMVHRVFQGPEQGQHGGRRTPPCEVEASPAKTGDLSARELSLLAVAVVATIWLGINPNIALKTAAPAIENLRSMVHLEAFDQHAETLEQGDQP